MGKAVVIDSHSLLSFRTDDGFLGKRICWTYKCPSNVQHEGIINRWPFVFPFFWGHLHRIPDSLSKKPLLRESCARILRTENVKEDVDRPWMLSSLRSKG